MTWYEENVLAEFLNLLLSISLFSCLSCNSNSKKHVPAKEVIAARELPGNMLLEMKDPVKVLAAYEADLLRHTNRLNGL